MASYNISQIAYAGKSGCLASYPVTDSASSGIVNPTNLLGSQDAINTELTTDAFGRAPYQQIILNDSYNSIDSSGDEILQKIPSEEYFEPDTPYFLRLKIPKNQNYDLNFALLLIPDPGEAADLDQMPYQFIRYIHVPKSTKTSGGSSHVMAYELPHFKLNNGDLLKNNDPDYWEYLKPNGLNNVYPIEVLPFEGKKEYVKVEELEEVPAEDPKEEDKEKIYYSEENQSIKYSMFIKSGMGENSAPGWEEPCVYYGSSNDRKKAYIGYAGAIINHSWVMSDSDDYCNYDIIFKPRGTSAGGLKFSKLYLYLIPESWDNDIRWIYKNKNTGSTIQFYGRHIDIERLHVELYKMKNLIKDKRVMRFGIWGRSELMFAVNGEEIKIGPSGYYELQDFLVTNLAVAAVDERDQFTIDLQYTS